MCCTMNGKRDSSEARKEGSRALLGDSEAPPWRDEMRGALALAGVPYTRLIAISRRSRATYIRAARTAPDSRWDIDAQTMAACWRAAGHAGTVYGSPYGMGSM